MLRVHACHSPYFLCLNQLQEIVDERSRIILASWCRNKSLLMLEPSFAVLVVEVLSLEIKCCLRLVLQARSLGVDRQVK